MTLDIFRINKFVAYLYFFTFNQFFLPKKGYKKLFINKFCQFNKCRNISGKVITSEWVSCQLRIYSKTRFNWVPGTKENAIVRNAIYATIGTVVLTGYISILSKISGHFI